jgi:hypothetical protein
MAPRTDIPEALTMQLFRGPSKDARATPAQNKLQNDVIDGSGPIA